MKEEVKGVEKIFDKYLEAVKRNVEKVQESGDIPTAFTYSFNEKTWVLTLPKSVMAQKRLIHLRNKYLTDIDDYELESELLNGIIKNVTVDGHQVGLEQLEYSELEVLRNAYMDSLLLPLSLGGEKAMKDYWTIATANIG